MEKKLKVASLAENLEKVSFQQLKKFTFVYPAQRGNTVEKMTNENTSKVARATAAWVLALLSLALNVGALLTYIQGSYWSSKVKFPDFSSHGMTISPTLSKQ